MKPRGDEITIYRITFVEKLVQVAGLRGGSALRE
jgi:hypothetical protein